VRGAVLLMALAGMVASGLNLLVPLALHDSGWTTPAIGAVFTVASALFIVTSTGFARAGERVVGLGVPAVVLASTAAALVLTADGALVTTLAGLLLLRGPLLAGLYTLTYPIGLAGAARAGVGSGAVSGVINSAYAATTVVTPLLAGAATEAYGFAVPYLALSALAGLLAAGLGRDRRRARAGAAWDVT
jgi:hypothetical protein